MQIPFIRSLLFPFIFILVLILPWWVSGIILAGLVIYFPLYLEVLFFGFLFDTLYSAEFSITYSGLTFAATFLFLVTLIKTQIRS